MGTRTLARPDPCRTQVSPPKLPLHRSDPCNSLGGAVSAHIAAHNLLPALCLCVIDVVEGSAMDALQSMQTYLSTRPQNFDSLEAGIQWHLRSRTIRNRKSARVSVPPLLVQDAGHWNWRTDLAKTRPFWEGNSSILNAGGSLKIGLRGYRASFWGVGRGSYSFLRVRIDWTNH